MMMLLRDRKHTFAHMLAWCRLLGRLAMAMQLL
jgi:hypothetical protein